MTTLNSLVRVRARAGTGFYIGSPGFLVVLPPDSSKAAKILADWMALTQIVLSTTEDYSTPYPIELECLQVLAQFLSTYSKAWFLGTSMTEDGAYSKFAHGRLGVCLLIQIGGGFLCRCVSWYTILLLLLFSFHPIYANAPEELSHVTSSVQFAR